MDISKFKEYNSDNNNLYFLYSDHIFHTLHCFINYSSAAIISMQGIAKINNFNELASLKETDCSRKIDFKKLVFRLQI